MASSDLEFGIWLLNIGDESVTNPRAFKQIATSAESAGFDALCVGDHLAIPEEIPPDYPFSESGEPPIEYTDENYHAFNTLSYVAAHTDSINLATNVCVVPYYHAINLLKQVLTLDALSDGRFEFGAGTGWIKPEFESLDVPFEERGSRTDEFLELLAEACEHGEFSHEGEHYSFPKAGFHPVPDDATPPTTWIGGGSGATIRRVAEFGHGWTTLWTHPEDVTSMRERLMNAWTDYNRNGSPGIAVVRPSRVGAENSDRLLMGTSDSVIEDIQAYKDAGVTRLFLTPPKPNIETQAEQIGLFQDEILPSF